MRVEKDEADAWKREERMLRAAQPGFRKGPIGRLLINTTRREFAHLNPHHVDFFQDKRQCYADCKWSDSDAVIFQALIPETPGILEKLKSKAFVHCARPSEESTSFGSSSSAIIARLEEPRPSITERLEAARWILEADRLFRSDTTFSCRRSADGLDEDAEITPEPAHFLPERPWLYADVYLVNLTQWCYMFCFVLCPFVSWQRVRCIATTLCPRIFCFCFRFCFVLVCRSLITMSAAEVSVSVSESDARGVWMIFPPPSSLHDTVYGSKASAVAACVSIFSRRADKYVSIQEYGPRMSPAILALYRQHYSESFFPLFIDEMLPLEPVGVRFMCLG